MEIAEKLEVYKKYIGQHVYHILYGAPDENNFSKIEIREGTLAALRLTLSGEMIVAELTEYPNYPINAQLLKIKDPSGKLVSIIEGV